MLRRREGLVVVTDRGGHLHNALRLLDQMQVRPKGLLVTAGPEAPELVLVAPFVGEIPYLFRWRGKQRRLDPWRALVSLVSSARYAWRLRPESVISLGASDVVPFCYFARLFGARIYHVECMNQVVTASVTGRMLYPIATAVYVQWAELKAAYGPKARYAGWVL